MEQEIKKWGYENFDDIATALEKFYDRTGVKIENLSIMWKDPKRKNKVNYVVSLRINND